MGIVITGRGSASRRHAKALEGIEADYAVIASLTPGHLRDLQSLAGFTGKCLIEKPLFQTYTDYRPSFPCFVGYQLRFHPAVKAIRKALEGRKVLSARVYAGQAIHFWKGSYHAVESKGGGVIRDYSHELDLVQYLIAPIESITGTASHDRAALTINGNIDMRLNYHDNPPRREWEIETDKGILHLDLTPIAPDATRDMHLDILGNAGNACTFDQGLAIVKWIDIISAWGEED